MFNTKTDSRIKLLFFLAGIPFLYFIIARKEPNWIYYTSLSMIFLGIIYGLVSDWKQGKQKQVKTRLITYAVLIIVLVAIGSFQNS
jgi:hypothetical protein